MSAGPGSLIPEEGVAGGVEAGVDPGHVVDARGLRCPLPVIRLAERCRGLPAGTMVAVRWTDPAARYDVPAWARMRGHAVVATEPEVATAPTRDANRTTDRAEDDGAPPADPAWVTTVRLT